jgi:hypothetical protein
MRIYVWRSYTLKQQRWPSESTNIGPECTNEGLFLGLFCSEDEQHWKKNSGSKHKKLVQEQRELDASGEAIPMLENALKGFQEFAPRWYRQLFDRR